MKKGFTLIELLAVIAIIGVLAVIVIPNVAKSYENSLIKLMETEENNMVTASDLFLEDYCISPISSEYSCPNTYVKATKTGYICLSRLQQNAIDSNQGYIDSIKFKSEECYGFVFYSIENSSSIKKAYLFCGYNSNDGTYEYATDSNYIPSGNEFSDCGVN